MTTVVAVYENGVLRLAEPLPLAEDQTVQVTITPAFSGPTPADEEYRRRLMAAKTLTELFAIMEAAPSLPEDYDIVQALDENRKFSGQSSWFPAGDTTP
jgi:predicted DNA-binding antitoxin AbrB/MazE fold protein